MHPLPNHPFAQFAAQAALAAGRQGRFLEMHETLLARYRNFNQLGSEKAAVMGLSADQRSSAEVQEAIFIDFASELGLNVVEFEADLKDTALRQQIVADTREAVSVGATGTPASFVNGRYLRGAQPFDAFKRLVDEALSGGGAAKVSP